MIWDRDGSDTQPNFPRPRKSSNFAQNPRREDEIEYWTNMEVPCNSHLLSELIELWVLSIMYHIHGCWPTPTAQHRTPEQKMLSVFAKMINHSCAIYTLPLSIFCFVCLFVCLPSADEIQYLWLERGREWAIEYNTYQVKLSLFGSVARRTPTSDNDEYWLRFFIWSVGRIDRFGILRAIELDYTQ